MKINYVIACYITNGVYRNNIYHRIDKFYALKHHLLTIEKERMPDVSKVTFVINKSDFVEKNEVDEVVQQFHGNSKHKVPIEVKYRDNWGHSYGAWEYHIRESLDENYDYYFLTEDDYVISLSDTLFYKPFISNFTDKTAFVCGLWTNHPAVSYGLYSPTVCKKMLDSYGEIFEGYNRRLLDKNIPYGNWQSDYHNHFIKSGYTITDTTDLIPTVFRKKVFGVKGDPVILPLL